MAKQKLLVVTNDYPLNGSHERAFLIADLKALLTCGFEVTLAPIHQTGEIDPGLPDGVKVTQTYAQAFHPMNLAIALLRVVIIRDFWREASSNPLQIFKSRFWKETIRLSASMGAFKNLVSEFNLFYTHWFTADTIGLAKSGATTLVTRAHNYDIYEEMDCNGGHIPYRRYELHRINKVITLSNSALEYMIDKFSISKNNVCALPLGVDDQHYLNEGGVPDEVVFFSCAFPSPRKRLDLIGKFIAVFSEKNPTLKVKWTHIGADQDDIEIECGVPKNMRIEAHGVLPREKVLSFYQEHPVSFFVNLSSSEGIPFAMMEAMSFGVPVIVSAVGGVPEVMAKGGGGIMFSVDATAESIAESVTHLMSEPGWRKRLGAEARSCQRQFYSAEKNSEAFASLLHSLVNSPS